eukprot:COSAG02_NODE_20256_length_841_cov_0.501348_2_plen_103_part_01
MKVERTTAGTGEAPHPPAARADSTHSGPCAGAKKRNLEAQSTLKMGGPCARVQPMVMPQRLALLLLLMGQTRTNGTLPHTLPTLHPLPTLHTLPLLLLLLLVV